jgi:tetratricopeptide (TPR) repeat protein
MIRLAHWGLALALLARGAAAAPDESPDVEIARRHFDRGSELYERGAYADAIVEFARARAAHPAAELDYNIARCYDRLEQRQPAIDAYERYLLRAPQAAGAGEARQRIAVLRARLPPPAGRRYAGPIALGAAALVVAGVAGGLVGSVAGPFHDLEQGACAAGCDPSTYAGLRARATAGYALFGIAGALAIGDFVWWGIAARRR